MFDITNIKKKIRIIINFYKIFLFFYKLKLYY